MSASVISRIDGVEAGVRPVGLGRKTVTAGGGVAGLLLGVGLVFLFANPVSAAGQLQTKSSVGVSVDVAASNGTSKVHSAANGNASHTVETKPGLFHGMTLEQAIRSVEHRG